jgi:phenylalanyl-tRNA synthetase beta chain
MKFSVNWLREFVELPPSIEALAELLTMSGVEIEAIEKRGADFDHVVIARIDDSKPHPNADRLSVCIVDDGSGTKRQIVCGAKNYKVGDKVPLALPGAELSGGLRIRASKLRGVESEGMLCSPKELGIAEDAAGLLILSPEVKIGAPIRDLFPPDTVLDVEITPNRGDLLSHFGLARDRRANEQTGSVAFHVGRRCACPAKEGRRHFSNARMSILFRAPN